MLDYGPKVKKMIKPIASQGYYYYYYFTSVSALGRQGMGIDWK